MHVCRYHFPEKGSVGAEARPLRKENARLRKFFSAKDYGSLAEAYQHALEYKTLINNTFPEEVPFKNLRATPHKNNRTSSIPGVFKASSRGASYWAACCPGGPNGDKPNWQKKFYISTHGEAAYDLAKEFRESWKKACTDQIVPGDRFCGQCFYNFGDQCLHLDPMTATNDQARKLFATSGLSYNDVYDHSEELLDLLEKELAAANEKTTLIQMTLSKKEEVRFTARSRDAESWHLFVDSGYFKGRQAISFEKDWIGFAGWASETNTRPFVAAFVKFVSRMIENKEA